MSAANDVKTLDFHEGTLLQSFKAPVNMLLKGLLSSKLSRGLNQPFARKMKQSKCIALSMLAENMRKN